MQILTGKLFKEMVLCGANTLHNNHPEIDALNVFPVPDGDTGTNMSMTFNAGAAEIKDMDSDNIYDIAKKLSKGLLMGARGNSGVILSQIFRGFAMGLEGHESVDAVAFANAWKSGAEVAYKAVMRPVEGTILTVIREASEKIVEYTQPGMEIEDVFSYFVKEAENSLERTPELLPVLKEVGVVDSGGAGLLLVLTGFMAALTGDRVDFVDIKSEGQVNAGTELESGEEGYGYCTEFIILGDASKAKAFQDEIEPLGDSMIVVGYDDVIKVHIHTNDPGLVLSKAVAVGELSKIKIDNMREEHRELLTSKEEQQKIAEEQAKAEVAVEKKKYAFISVAMGEGITHVLKDLGVDYVIEGGQTMNPSTQDMMECISKLNADHIFILPNNKNIIMAATQAAEISDKDVRVIPTKSIPQGITCITMFNSEHEVDENEAA